MDNEAEMDNGEDSELEFDWTTVMPTETTKPHKNVYFRVL